MAQHVVRHLMCHHKGDFIVAARQPQHPGCHCHAMAVRPSVLLVRIEQRKFAAAASLAVERDARDCTVSLDQQFCCAPLQRALQDCGKSLLPTVGFSRASDSCRVFDADAAYGDNFIIYV